MMRYGASAMKQWYQCTGNEVLQRLQVTADGLTEQQVLQRRKEFGENRLEETGTKPAWKVFLEQFQDMLVMILIGAAVISMLTDNVESTVVIFAVITLNAVLGTVQHEKAQKSLESLKALSAPIATALRDGKKREVPSAEIVPGDILYLEAGDLVVADGRILEQTALQVNESSLTGESAAVCKTAAPISRTVSLADRENMVYSGSLVTSGRAVMVVTAAGMDTEIGGIAMMMNDAGEKRTPLQVSLDQFSGRLAAIIMVICLVVFLLSLYRKMPVLDSLMFAVALAVAAIPEALGTIVTIVQAMGTQKMAREQAIIKDLKAVESLGCVSVICTDKTGTLTQNRMNVEQVVLDGKMVERRKLQRSNPRHRQFLEMCALVNDAEVNRQGEGGGAETDQHRIGDATELALLDFVQDCGMSPAQIRSHSTRVREIPFDSERKIMSTVQRETNGSLRLLTKGALDILLDRCTRIDADGKVRPMTSADRKTILQYNQTCSEKGLRVLALVFRPLKAGEERMSQKELERDYIFSGLAAMMDPPRPETPLAVQDARRAGIRPIMITGDHKVTAMAIAEQIGIRQDGDLAVTGPELNEMKEEQLKQQLPRITVYARVAPEHKLRIVRAWQSRGNIVAMTGDGVNDAPALKQADIGVAMGKTGTEVSKDAADMILADDNFATIIKAVSNGRNVYRNILNAIQFLLSGNMAGILCVLYTTLLALPLPFAPVHLLFINLLTDSLPALAIGMEQPEDGLLDEAPRNPKKGILSVRFSRNILIQGVLIGVCTICAYWIGLLGIESFAGLRAIGQTMAQRQHSFAAMTGSLAALASGHLAVQTAVASTMAFSTLTLARLFHGFNCRSSHSIFRLGLFSNMYTVMAFEAGVLLLAAVLFIPGLRVLFAVENLTMGQLGCVVLFAFIPTAVIQTGKLLREHVRGQERRKA